MEITAAMVRELREKTGLPMMDCKKALAESGGDMEKAIEWLRKAGHGRVEKLKDRTASQGRVVCHVDAASQRAALLELCCETEPVANMDDFVKVAEALARQAAASPGATAATLATQKFIGDPSLTVQDKLTDLVNRIRENIFVGRVATFGGNVAHYIHHDCRKGTMVEFNRECPAGLAGDVCMHVTALRPRVLRREDVPAEDVARERAALAEEVKGKPANIIDKIVSGKLDRWFSEFVLLEQPFVKDDKHTVAQVLNQASPGLTISRFARFEIGGS